MDHEDRTKLILLVNKAGGKYGLLPCVIAQLKQGNDLESASRGTIVLDNW